jgi:RNAse (barnase) inhibitor barstar
MHVGSELKICIATPNEFDAYAYRLNQQIGATHAVRVVRGKKMRTATDLFDEFAAAFQFPDYFGENWNAFDECLDDLEWLPATEYVLLLLEAGDALSHESEEEFSVFIRILHSVSQSWHDTQQKTFEVLLQCEAQDVAALQHRARVPLEIVRVNDISLSGNR